MHGTNMGELPCILLLNAGIPRLRNYYWMEGQISIYLGLTAKLLSFGL